MQMHTSVLKAGVNVSLVEETLKLSKHLCMLVVFYNTAERDLSLDPKLT